MKTLKTLFVALAAALLSTGCFEKVSDRTEYLLKPLVQYTSGGLAEPLGEVVAYAFAADTAEWGVASYEDALAGIVTAKENPAERIETPLATAAPCETEGMTDRIRMSLPAGSLMLLAVDTQHRLYAYTQQELVENLGTLYVSLVFKPWREGTAYQEKWSFYNPFYEPAPQLVCFVRAAAAAEKKAKKFVKKVFHFGRKWYRINQITGEPHLEERPRADARHPRIQRLRERRGRALPLRGGSLAPDARRRGPHPQALRLRQAGDRPHGRKPHLRRPLPSLAAGVDRRGERLADRELRGRARTGAGDRPRAGLRSSGRRNPPDSLRNAPRSGAAG